MTRAALRARDVFTGSLALGVLAIAPAPAVAQAGGLGAPARESIDASQSPWSRFEQHPLDDGHSCHQGCGKATAARLRELAGEVVNDGEPWSFASREAFTDTDLISVDLDIDCTPAPSAFISGTNTMVLESKVNGLTQLTFFLRRNYTVSAVTVNGVAVAPPGLPPTNSYARVITLDRAYNAGEQFSVRVTYSGAPVNVGLGSIVFGTQNGVPIMSSLSQPYYAATWWPVKDGDVFQPGNNSDKSIGRISITVPDTLKAVSNGLLESTDVPSAGKKRFRWRTNYATPSYLYFFSATNYNQWTRTYNYPLPGGGTGSMPVEFSIYPASDTPANRAQFEKCVDMLPVFASLLGEYPFVNEKYGMYQFPFSGGMEHQTYTGQGVFVEYITAHELGHQWLGDSITCKTWNDIWINEGGASYCEVLWEEFKPGSSGAAARKIAINDRKPSTTNGTVFCPTTNDVGRIFSGTFSYDKGAWAYHQLRGVLGDAVFFQTLRTLLDTYRGGALTTADFESVAESVSGKDLTTFFEQVIMRTGAPSYATGFQNATIDGNAYVRVSVRQTQPGTYGIAGRYQFPIDVGITPTSGAPFAVEVNNTAVTQHYLIPVAGAVSSVTLDPDDWILTDAKVSEAYQNGPVKLVSVSPVVNAELTALQASDNLRLVFSERVNATPSVLIVGPSGSPAFTPSLDATGTILTIDPSSPLEPGAYSVTVLSAVANASGIGLDGELVAGAFPSGDGIVGGQSVWAFSVAAPTCNDLDFNNDGVFPDNADIVDFVAVFAGAACPTDPPVGAGCDALDFNNDGIFPDNADIVKFVEVFAGAPC
jgi:hypothetical protein